MTDQPKANNKELEMLCDECGLSMELCTELNMLTMRQYPPISKERKQDVEYARKLIRAELQRFADEVEDNMISVGKQVGKESGEPMSFAPEDDNPVWKIISAVPLERLSAIKKKWNLR